MDDRTILMDDRVVLMRHRTILMNDRMNLLECRIVLMDDRMNLRHRRTILMQRRIVLLHRRTVLMDNRMLLTDVRTALQPGKMGKTIRHGAESSVLAQNDSFGGGISSETDFSTAIAENRGDPVEEGGRQVAVPV
jgi:hypothetical protein